MAKTISAERIALDIIINGDPAKKELNDLTSKNTKLKTELKDLNEQYKSNEKELKNANVTIDAHNKKIKDLTESFDKISKAYDVENAKLKKIETQYGKNSNEYKNQELILKNLEIEGTKLWNLREKEGKALVKLGEKIRNTSNEYKDFKDKVKAIDSAITSNSHRMEELQKEIGLTGLSMAQLQAKARDLNATLRHLSGNTTERLNIKNQLDEVNNQITVLKGKALQSKASMGTFADSFNRYQGLAVASVAAFTGVAYSISKVIDINAKLSDAQANVIKTTEMTKQEVDDLTKSFSELNTRTSRVDLLKIAEQGGRLGVPKAEIQDFVKSMNIAAVALGDSFTGGVDEVAEKLGKIKFLFKETSNMGIEQAYNSIGSAINDLGADGVASELQIAEFTTRIGSLTDVLKPTVQETLALGTAFAESGLEAEVSSRAYNIFMKQASTEADKFAKVMNISKKSVEDMINTNPMNFMLEFAKGMRGMDATQTAKTLDYLGINADGANKVIGAMGNNFDRFHQLIDLSNKSFYEGTSLINEYRVKNENLAATLEKINKKISGWFSSETFIKYLGGLVSWFGKFIGATEDADGSVTKWRNGLFFTAKILAVLISSLVGYRATMALIAIITNGVTTSTTLLNIAIKAQAVGNSFARIGLVLYTGTLALLGQTSDVASAKLARLNLVTKASPWGALVAVLVAVAAAYVLFSNKVDNATKIQNNFNDIAGQTKKSVDEETTSLRNLLKIATDETQSKQVRLNAIKEINKISPEYLGNITLENLKTAESKKAINAYIESLTKQAEAKAISSKLSELYSLRMDVENKKLEDSISWYEMLWNTVKNGGDAIGTISDNVKTGIKNRLIEVKNINEQIKALEEKAKTNLVKDLSKTVTTNYKSSYNTNLGDSKDKSKSEKKDPNSLDEELNKLYLDHQQKFTSEYLKNQQQFEDDKIALMEDGVAKDLAIENQRYAKKVAELKSKKVHTDEIAKLDEEASKAYQAGDIKKYDALLFIKEQWVARNSALDKQVTQIEQQERGIHNKKLHELELKSFDQSVKDTVDKYEHEKLLRDTAYNNELADAVTNSLLREEITKKHKKKEIEAQLKHLQDLANLMKFELFSPAGLSLTEKERKYFKEKLDLYLNAISKIKEAQKVEGKEIDLGIKVENDILGFSKEQWEGFFKNIEQGTIGFQTMAMAMGVAANILGEMDKLFTAQENAEVKRSEGAANAKKNHLKKQLDSGLINQKQYNRRIEKIDKELDDKKFEAELAQAKRQRVISLANIAIKTAESIMSIASTGGGTHYADFGITAGILTALTIGMGIAQAATVLATPLPVKGYEDGLYSQNIKRQQDGKIFKANFGGQTKSGIVNKPTYFLTGENGPEMIIDSQSYAQMPPSIRQSLESYIFGRTNNMRGYEQGYYSQPTPKYTTQTTTQPAQTSSNNDELMKMMLQVMSENVTVLREIKDNGILAMVDSGDYRAMKNIRTGIKNYEELLNKSKK